MTQTIINQSNVIQLNNKKSALTTMHFLINLLKHWQFIDRIAKMPRF